PSSPRVVTCAAGTAIFGTPPGETLICTIRPFTPDLRGEPGLASFIYGRASAGGPAAARTSTDCTRAAPPGDRVPGIRLTSACGGSCAGRAPPAPARRAGSGRGGDR